VGSTPTLATQEIKKCGNVSNASSGFTIGFRGKLKTNF
jgi:hypothetical protein